MSNKRFWMEIAMWASFLVFLASALYGGTLLTFALIFLSATIVVRRNEL